MPKYCCVTNCNGSNGKGFNVYRFPKDKDERERWKNTIPRDNIPDHPDTVVCSQHWPADTPMIKFYGKLRPKNPPSIFPGIPKSMIPTPPPDQRKTTTQKTLPSNRNIIPDEIDLFMAKDVIGFGELKEKFVDNDFNFDTRFQIISYVMDDTIVIQSKQLQKPSCIPTFLLQIRSDLTYESYHCGVLCTIQSLSSNRIKKLQHLSSIEEALAFLNSCELDNKKNVLLEQVAAMCPIPVGNKKYSMETIVRSFEYFALSRSLYSRLRDDYELPSIVTLTRLTSKVSNIDDSVVLKNVLSNVTRGQKSFIVLIDEVYVKPALRYHGGSVFGKAVNKPSEIATTILSFFLVGQFGGPKFLFRMIPVVDLNADFLFAENKKLVNCVREAGGNVVAIISDNNRVNQKFFKMFSCAEKQWLTVDGIFLFFDFVHLFKSIRNNWITEKTKELEYSLNGDVKTARWSDIVKLYRDEETNLVKKSRLTEVSVFPKPIERQKVAHCVKIFSESVIAALKSSNKKGELDGTIGFIELVMNFWKVVNVKGLTADIRFNDPLRSPIRSLDNSNLEFLTNFASVVDRMKPSSGIRMKQLTKDTANSLSHTCRALVDLSKHMLSTTHDYVLLGIYTTDYLEKAFGKLRQGSGGTYFITCQQVLEKLNIQKTKLLLRHDVNVSELNVEAGHHCDKCNYLMSTEAINVFDNVEALEKSLNIDVKEALIYIAGYITRKDKSGSGTFFYFDKFGMYQKEIDRGKLAVPCDAVVQWVFFSYILFNEINSSVCKKSLTNALMALNEVYSLNISKEYGMTMSNILLNNYAHLYSPVSSKERKQKLLKLSKD